MYTAYLAGGYGHAQRNKGSVSQLTMLLLENIRFGIRSVFGNGTVYLPVQRKEPGVLYWEADSGA